VIAAFAGLVFAVQSFANELPKLSLEQLVSRSDVVVIGTVMSFQRGSDSSDHGLQNAVISVTTTLKGNPGHTIVVVARGDSPEEDAGALQLRAAYLLFLFRGKDGVFHAVNGPRSVFSVPPPANH
jgi:hypothetical protein